MSDLGLYRGLGSKLIEQGKIFLNKATPMNKTSWGASTIANAVSDITGLPLTKIYSADSYHHTTDIDNWRIIIEHDWTNKKKWTAEIFDCDNFAGAFSAYSADIYYLNSAGLLTVELRDLNGKHIGYHRCIIIIDDKLRCWLLESQSDQMILMEKGKKFIIENWEYIPNYFSIN